jgi:hypothetical protein
MVRQRPKGYSRRQQDKHLERLKNKQCKIKKSKVIILKEDKTSMRIASDFSQILVEKKQLLELLKNQENINLSMIQDNLFLIKRVQKLERTLLCLIGTVISLLALIGYVLL